jgi:hypothetical protein
LKAFPLLPICGKFTRALLAHQIFSVKIKLIKSSLEAENLVFEIVVENSKMFEAKFQFFATQEHLKT